MLGEEPSLEIEDEAREAARAGRQLVLVVVGRRVTPRQRGIVEEAIRVAGEVRVSLDAVWVTSAEEARDLVSQGDEVTILASGGERRWLERALGRQRSASEILERRDGARPGTTHELRWRRGRREGAGAREPRTEQRVIGPTFSKEAPQRGAEQAALSVVRDVSELPQAQGKIDIWPGIESVEALVGREVPQPIIRTVWTKELAESRKRAPFRIYLGMAPGVGKTYAMLSEGHRRRSRGTDVVVGIAETYGRPKTIEMLRGLEVVPPRKIVYRGVTFEEMDTEAVIARRPEVVLVDELAHTNIPGSRRAKRWEDVLDLLAEGILVITTLNVQHLESLNDVIAAVTGVRQRETVPDWVFDLADQVELVDMSPYSLRRRIIHGNVYPDVRKAELALQRFFTEENLTALRELALMRVANQVDEDLLRRWTKEGSPETRERILVCVSRPQVSDALIRRGARMAQRARGDLLVVHAVTEDEQPDRAWIRQVEELVHDLGGEFHVIEGDDPVEAVLSFAYRHRATQIVVGESLRPRWRELLGGSFVTRLIRSASNIDVHVIARKER